MNENGGQPAGGSARLLDLNAEQMKVHTMLVIGNRDMEANAVSLRVPGKGNLGAKPAQPSRG